MLSRILKPVGDRAPDLGRDLFVQLGRLVAVDLDTNHGASNSRFILTRMLSPEAPPLPVESGELLADLVDPEALIKEARRRQRRRRMAVAVLLLGVLAGGLGLYALVTPTSRTHGPSTVPRSASPWKTMRVHVAGFGTPLPSAIDQGPCSQGRTLMAIRSTTGERLGTLRECVLKIAKTDTLHYGVRRIVAITLDAYALPGGTIGTREVHTILFARDQRHTTAIFRGRIVRSSGRYTHARGTLSGGGRGVDGKADWLVELRRAMIVESPPPSER